MSQSSVFENLDAIRLSTTSAGLVGTQEVLRTIPLRKPGRQEFVRVHPDPAMSIATGVFVDQEERDVYFVAPHLWGELAGEMKSVRLVLTITRQGTPFFWPVPLPTEDGRRSDWHESAREACELAATHWIRMAPEMSLGAYRIFKAEGHLSDPHWPAKPLQELLEIAFKGRIIDSIDHPMVKRLWGRS